MKEAIKKEINYALTQTIAILEAKDAKDSEELKTLSDHAIEDVAVHKDLDLISITVLIYSIYKILPDIKLEEYSDLVKELNSAKKHLGQDNLGRYNRSIKTLFTIIGESQATVKVHLQDVMQAARIKKGATLLHHGLSIGQAAGLMGLSNWDLQQYIGKTTSLSQHEEAIPIAKRITLALKLFGVKA